MSRLAQLIAVTIYIFPCGFASGGEIPAKSVNGWPGMPYSRVIGYSFDNPHSKDDVFTLLRDDKLNEAQLKEFKTKEAPLNAAQVERLLNAAFSSKIRILGAACYEPHHVFVFYDRDAKPVAAIEICFHCDKLVSLPEKDTDWHHDFAALARLSWELGLGLGSPKLTLDGYLELLKQRHGD